MIKKYETSLTECGEEVFDGFSLNDYKQKMKEEQRGAIQEFKERYNEKKKNGLQDIKNKYNELCQKVNVDTKALTQAIQKKRLQDKHPHNDDIQMNEPLI